MSLRLLVYIAINRANEFRDHVLHGYDFTKIVILPIHTSGGLLIDKIICEYPGFVIRVRLSLHTHPNRFLHTHLGHREIRLRHRHRQQ